MREKKSNHQIDIEREREKEGGKDTETEGGKDTEREREREGERRREREKEREIAASLRDKVCNPSLSDCPTLPWIGSGPT